MTLTTEDLTALKATFAANEHEFLQGNAYIQEQPITDRIESIDPAWSFEIRGINVRANAGEGGKDVFTVAVHAALTIKGVTRENVGMGIVQRSNPIPETIWKNNKKEETGKQYTNEANEGEKAATTDALKRCARLFGIGRYLLTLPNDVKDMGSMERWLTGQKKSVVWTDNLQQMEWLKAQVVNIREMYGDAIVDKVKAELKTSDYTEAKQYANVLHAKAKTLHQQAS